MADFDATQVGIAKGNPGGYGWVAASGTTLPTDASTSLTDDYEGVGYISEDGVTVSSDQDTEEQPDWAGNIIKLTRGSFTETVQVTFLQSATVVLGLFYGEDNVTDDGLGNVTIKHNGGYSDEHVLVFESLIDDSTVMRTVVPRAVLEERGDVVQNNSELLKYEATFRALADEDGNSIYEYRYTATA